MSILVVGSVALDWIKTPFGAVEAAVGGSAIYFAAGASLFAPVRVVAVAGEDFPLRKVEFLRKRGVDFTGLEIAKGKTFQWHGEYTLDWNNAVTHDTQLNVFETFSPKIPESFVNSEMLFLANIHPRLQLDVLDQMERPKLIGLDTMNFWITGELELLKQVLKRVDIAFLNDGEAKLLSKEHNLVKAADRIFELGPKTLVLKKGEHGVVLFNEGRVFAFPAYPVRDICDPTGAGDSFAAGFMGCLAKTDQVDEKSMRQAIVYGSTIASYTVTEFSFNRLKTLTQADIDARYNEFVELTRFW